MLRFKSILTGLLGLLCYLPVSAQNSAVSVDNFTGSAIVSVPLYNVSSGSVSMPVMAVYQAGGVKVKDPADNLGLHMQLVAGGQVSRMVRGLPDDIKEDNAAPSNARLGWIYNTNGTKINSFTIANDNNTAVCTDETADNNYITSNFNDLSDTEPDIFSVNAPGLSFQFIFDNNHVIKFLSYQDLKVTYTTALMGRIESFTVTNSQGVYYVFAAQELETRKVANPGTVSYFKRKYNQYLNGLTYNRSWKLTEISSINGGGVNIFYVAGGVKKFSNDVVSVVLPGAGTSTAQYTINTTYTPLMINSIATGNQDGIYATVLSFDSKNAGQKLNNVYEDITGLGRHITMTYTAGAGRTFLQNITSEGAGVKKQYGFSYSGLVYVPLPGSNVMTFPDSTSKELDYWGYYNASSATSLVPQVYTNPANTALERYRAIAPGSSASSYPYTLSGTDRSANLAAAMRGSLSKVYSNNGDTTYLEYELNTFYDNTAGAVKSGGGIRVKKITAFDGYDAANNVVTNYTYPDAVTGTSGRAITMPSFAFTTPYTGSGATEAKWASSTVRSENDLSEEDETVIYKSVKIARSGGGSVVYEYAAPATYWDASGSPDWIPTTINSGRTACASASFAANQANNYPYAPNPNFDFERGLLQKVSAYNEAGNQVSEDNYNYQRSASPVLFTGLKFDDNGTGARNYAKYSLLTGVSKLISTQSKKVFDLPALTTYQSSSKSFYYNSSAHKLPTRTDAVNSDGQIVRNYIKYVKDYTTVLGSDSMANSLYRLRQQGLNFPVEQYQQVQRGSSTVTTGASLTLYKRFIFSFFDHDLPVQSLQLVSANGLTDFQPSAITSGAFTRDSRYIVKANYLTYDFNGELVTADDNKHNSVTTLTDMSSGQRFLTIKNAASTEFAFDDFDSNYPSSGFTYSDTVKTANDRNGQYSRTIKPATSITRTGMVNKGTSANYIFSLWALSTAASINIQVTDGVHTNNATLTIPGGQWKYLETKVPVANLNGTFNVSITPSTTLLVDDILFYPENAQVSTTAYNKESYAKLSETNSTGVSVYYGYDQFGRPKFVYDQDKNILQKKTYVDVQDYNGYNADFVVSLSGTDTLNYGSKISFLNSDQTYLEGTKWSWNFGDGSPLLVSTKIDTIHSVAATRYNGVLHAYTHTGNFTATLTKTSPVAGTVTSSKTFYISNHSNINVPFSILNRPGGVITNVAYSGTYGSDTELAAQINLGDLSAKQGIYNITANVSGTLFNPSTGNGFKCVYLTNGSRVLDCVNYHAGNNIYNFYNVDLNGSESLQVYLSADDCSVINPISESSTTPPPSENQ